MLKQDVLRRCRHAQGLQPRVIAEQREVPLVGVQRMGLRVRCQHDSLVQIGFAQRGAARLLQVEVGQAVVDQIDGQIAVPQHAVAPFECGRIGDDRAQAMPLEQLLEQQELGVEVLILGRHVDDGDSGQRTRAFSLAGRQIGRQPTQLPFVPKHGDNLMLEACHAGERGHHGIHRSAAGMLSARQHGIEHRSAGVGVDLDQPEMPFAQMEVIAEECTEWPPSAEPRDGRRGVQHLLAVGR